MPLVVCPGWPTAGVEKAAGGLWGGINQGILLVPCSILLISGLKEEAA
jgi:hypothetical protein